jgi:HlyD family type I secretion membrane fusion protein
VDGYVLNLTQFTIGGMAGAGETLLDVVPEGEAMIVTVQVRPQDIDEVRAGMEARVRLNAFNQRWVSPLKARVLTVSADRLADAKDGRPFFRADLRIDPSEISKLPKNVKLKPGMPADAMIVTGERTVMGYLISPVRDTLSDAFREE